MSYTLGIRENKLAPALWMLTPGSQAYELITVNERDR